MSSSASDHARDAEPGLPVANREAVRHTPGPWEIDRDGGIPAVYMSHAKAWITFSPSVSGFGYDATDELEANARLMAAAPDLLALALAIREAADLAGITMNGPLATMARAAIAKALPEAPR